MIGIDRGKISSTMINEVNTMTPRQNDLVVNYVKSMCFTRQDKIVDIMIYIMIYFLSENVFLFFPHYEKFREIILFLTL